MRNVPHGARAGTLLLPIALLVLFVLLVGCSDDPVAPPGGAKQPATPANAELANWTLGLDPSHLLVDTGEHVQLTPRWFSADGNRAWPLTDTQYLSWSSENPAIATVNENGLVEAHGPGLVRVSAIRVPPQNSWRRSPDTAWASVAVR